MLSACELNVHGCSLSTGYSCPAALGIRVKISENPVCAGRAGSRGGQAADPRACWEALQRAWRPFAAAWKAPWWDCVSEPEDVPNAAAFRRGARGSCSGPVTRHRYCFSCAGPPVSPMGGLYVTDLVGWVAFATLFCVFVYFFPNTLITTPSLLRGLEHWWLLIVGGC